MGGNSKSAAKKVLIIFGAAAFLYFALCASLFAIMLQPPDRFARAMAHVPWPAFMALPFKPLWSIARSGNVGVGEPAPDFHLQSPDGKTDVRLSDFRGRSPVVLIFGSYT